MLDKHLLESILEISSPWELRDVRLDPGKRRCDIWVERKKGSHNWFGPRREAVLPEKTWRHFNTLNTQTWVHVTPPLDAKLDDLPWAGDDQHCFTHAMAGQLLTMLDNGLTLEAVCRVMDISVADLWRYKYALERRRNSAAASAAGTQGPRQPPGTDANSST